MNCSGSSFSDSAGFFVSCIDVLAGCSPSFFNKGMPTHGVPYTVRRHPHGELLFQMGASFDGPRGSGNAGCLKTHPHRGNGVLPHKQELPKWKNHPANDSSVHPWRLGYSKNEIACYCIFGALEYWGEQGPSRPNPSGQGERRHPIPPEKCYGQSGRYLAWNEALGRFGTFSGEIWRVSGKIAPQKQIWAAGVQGAPALWVGPGPAWRGRDQPPPRSKGGGRTQPGHPLRKPW